jgi:hypothetical protein
LQRLQRCNDRLCATRSGVLRAAKRMSNNVMQ